MPQERRIKERLNTTSFSKAPHSHSASLPLLHIPLMSLSFLNYPPSLSSYSLLHHSTVGSLPPLSPFSWKKTFLLLLCFLFFPGTDLHGLFEEPCSVLAWRLWNLQVLIQLSVPGLGLSGEPEVDLHPINSLLRSQNFRGDPAAGVIAREWRERERETFSDALWHSRKKPISFVSMTRSPLTFPCVTLIKRHH